MSKKDLNKVMIIGRLGKDPEMRFTPNGQAVTNFTVAAGRQWKDPTTGESKEETEWFSVVAWGKLAEIMNQYITKGTRVYLEGRIQTRSWDDQTSGEKKYRTEVVANEMIILDNRNEAAGGGMAHAQVDEGGDDWTPPSPPTKRADPAKLREAAQTRPRPAPPQGRVVTEDDLPF